MPLDFVTDAIGAVGDYVPGIWTPFGEQSAGGQIAGFFSSGQDPMQPMDYDEAFDQAEQILGPRFEQQRQDLSRQQRQRGFYGQMPGDVMEQQLASQQTAQTGQFAHDLRQQDWQMQMQQEELGGDGFWGTVGGIAGGFLGGPGGAAVGQGIADWLF